MMATFPDARCADVQQVSMAGPACALTMQGPGRGLVASEVCMRSAECALTLISAASAQCLPINLFMVHMGWAHLPRIDLLRGHTRRHSRRTPDRTGSQAQPLAPRLAWARQTLLMFWGPSWRPPWAACLNSCPKCCG